MRRVRRGQQPLPSFELTIGGNVQVMKRSTASNVNAYAG
jgi:hypothetical protein